MSCGSLRAWFWAQSRFMAMVSSLVARRWVGPRALAWGFDRWVGAWCLSVAGPTVAQLEVFFSSDYLWVMGPFLCFVMEC